MHADVLLLAARVPSTLASLLEVASRHGNRCVDLLLRLPEHSGNDVIFLSCKSNPFVLSMTVDQVIDIDLTIVVDV